jgi:hypothetical protein
VSLGQRVDAQVPFYTPQKLLNFPAHTGTIGTVSGAHDR